MIIQSSYRQRVGAPKRAIINFFYKGFDILLFKQERKNNKSASHDLSLRKKKSAFFHDHIHENIKGKKQTGYYLFFSTIHESCV